MREQARVNELYTHRTDLETLEARIGYVFSNRELLVRALTHRSYANENDDVDSDNQRLEFLGDAVLGLVTAELLFKQDTGAQEGALSARQSQMVCESALAELARLVGLGSFIRLGKGESITGGRQKSGLLSDAYEALLAAIFLDGGVDAVHAVVARLHQKDLEEVSQETSQNTASNDFKSMFQRVVQGEQALRPEYIIIEEYGPAHSRTFVAEVRVDDCALGRGTGRSKKQAEQFAAQQALLSWEEIKHSTNDDN